MLPELTPEQYATLTKWWASVAPCVMLIVGMILGYRSDRPR
jgi:hypothetical protein